MVRTSREIFVGIVDFEIFYKKYLTQGMRHKQSHTTKQNKVAKIKRKIKHSKNTENQVKSKQNSKVYR